MAKQLSTEEWLKLAELARRASLDETTSDSSSNTLNNVAIYASRMGGN